MSYSAIVIPADPSAPLRRITVTGIEELQAAVGGSVDHLEYGPDEHITTYLHADAKHQPEPLYNARATRLLGPGLLAGDCVCGDVVVCGFDPHRREDRDCPEGFEEVIAAAGRPLPVPTEINAEDRAIILGWQLAVDEHGDRTVAVLHTHYVPDDPDAATSEPGPGHYSAMLDTRRYTHVASHTLSTVRVPARELATASGPYSIDGLTAFLAEVLRMLRDRYNISHPVLTTYFRTATGGSL